MIQVIAFDLDDTLWEVHPVIVRAEEKLNEWLSHHAPLMQHDAERMRSLRNQLVAEKPELAHQLTALRRNVIQASLEAGGYGEEAQPLAEQAMQVFLHARNDVAFFAGVTESLATLKESFIMGALTNGNADITRVGLDRFFSFAFSAEEVGAPKPAPDLFHAALAHTDVDPHHMIYVGDDPALDIDAANALGIRTIHKHNPRKPAGETAADATIHSLHELPDAVTAIIESA